MLVALLGVLVLGVWGAFTVFAASGPSAPSLTQTPANPTNQASTTFKYSENQINATFACTVDGTATPCTSSNSGSTTVGQSAVGPLADGSHTFSIMATVSGKTSSATSFTWKIDTTAPAVALTFPTNGVFVNSAGWTAGCSGGAGICGAASDATGVASVKVSVLQQSSGKYWNGSSFVSAAEVYAVATGTTSWRLPLALPTAGSYMVHVTATDTLGNASASPITASFTVDTTAPPAPTITSGPSGTVSSKTAIFQFTSSDTGPGTDTFLCKLDSGSYAACASGIGYSALSDGSHTFTVEAKDAAGNISATAATRTWTVDTTGPLKPTIVGPNNKSDSTSATFTITDSESPVTYKCQVDGGGYLPCSSNPTYTLLTPGTHIFDAEPIDQYGNIGPFNEWKWTINGLSGSGMPFTITSSSTGVLLSGGPAVALNLTMHNPNSVSIYVTSLSLSLTSVSPVGSNTCGTGNFNTPTTWTGGYPLMIPAGGSKSLSDFTSDQTKWPHLTMKDSGNQDGCANATVNFTYDGQAQS